MEHIDAWSLVTYLWNLLLTIVGVLAMRTIKRMDTLEKKSATKADIKDLKEDIKQVRHDFREDMRLHREESASSMAHIIERVENIYDILIGRKK